MAASSRTRKRVGRAKGGKRAVSRTHTRSTPTFGSPSGSTSTKRKATVTTKGGLKRTAKVSKTTTGSGPGRVSKTRKVITRVKNGRKVKTVVTRVNRGGKVTTTKTPPKVTKAAPKRPGKSSGGTTAPRKARKRK